jgi:two-component system, response regulator
MMKDYDPVQILIVEDNPNDAELTLRALRKHNLANEVYVAEDGQEALDFIFCDGKFSTRSSSIPLKVIFLDLKLPKISRHCSQLLRPDKLRYNLLLRKHCSSIY